jgi:hypothetical protein
MIVEDQMDCRVGRVGCIEDFENSMNSRLRLAILCQGVNLAGQQVDTG